MGYGVQLELTMNNDHDSHKTLESYRRALEFFSKIKNSREAAKKLLDLGHLYKDLRDHEKAMVNYNLAYQLYKDEKDIYGEAIAFKFMADIYKEENNYSEARRYYQKALNKFHNFEDYQMEKTILALISSCYQAEGALEDAIIMEKMIGELDLNNESSKKIQYDIDRLKKKTVDVWPTRNQSYILIFYVMIMVFGELITNYYLNGGLIFQVILMVILTINSTSTSSHRFSYLLQAMILLPLIRIMSIIIPLSGIQSLYWILIMLVPITAAIIVLMQSQNINRKNIGFTRGNLPLQLGIGFTGLIFGYMEYQIIQPAALIPGLDSTNMIIIGMIIIMSAGFLEELIFRGVIQRNAENLMGKVWGIIFASVLFTIFNIGWNSLAHPGFIFLVSMFYGYAFQKTRSILGVGISHGLCNIVLFVILPFL